MIFRAFILSTLACASAQTSSVMPATSGSRNPAFSGSNMPATSGSRNPAFSGSNMPATSGSSNPAAAPASSGSSGSGSCAVRFGAPCDFQSSDCCNVINFNVLLPSAFTTEVTCSVAKAQYNSAQSSSWSETECTTVKDDIELSGGLNCYCAAAPTPAPEQLGACVLRQNASAYTPCDFVAEKNGCCPNTDASVILDPSVLDLVPCAFVNASLYTDASTNWTDTQCRETKVAIEALAFEIDGCVCPDSPLLKTMAPTPAPVVPTIPPTPFPTDAPTPSSASTLAIGGAAAFVLAFFV